MNEQANWQHDRIVTNGVQLHYVTQGTGPLMLFLHGFPEFWYSWRHQIPEFARDHKVVALDLRGYNDSEKPDSLAAYRLPVLVEDIRGVIQGLGYDRCTLIGHDWGGIIAWSFAYAHPGLLERLIILNVPHPAKLSAGMMMPQQLLKSSYIFFFQLPLLPEAVLQWNDYGAIAAAIKGTATNKAAFSEVDLDAYKTAASKRGALTAALNYYRNLLQDGLGRRDWPILTVPTLMIWGEKDTALGVELTYGTEEFVEDLRICYIPDSGHWVQQEQPQQVNTYIREFLAVPTTQEDASNG